MSDVLFPIRRDRVGNPIQSDIDMALRLGLNADGTARKAQAAAEADERQHVALVEAQGTNGTLLAPLPDAPEEVRTATRVRQQGLGGIEIDSGTIFSPNEIARRLSWSVSLAEQQVRGGENSPRSGENSPLLQERLDAILAAAADRRIDPGLYKIVHALAHAPCPRPGQNLSGNRTESARDPGNAPSGNRTKVTR